MKVIVILIVVGALGTIPKEFVSFSIFFDFHSVVSQDGKIDCLAGSLFFLC